MILRPAHRPAFTLLICLFASACQSVTRQPDVEPAAAGPARFLYVWAGDKDERESDFMAVVDVRASSPTYGKVVATEPVNVSGTLPHHMEYQLPRPGELLFVNGHHHEQIFLFRTDSADRPRLVGKLPPVPPYRFPHDFIRMPNRNVLVGYLRSEGPSPLRGDSINPGGHGGIAEFTPDGRFIRSASAAVAGDTIPIRTYAFALLPKHDRFLTTSAPMMENASADVVQVWSMSDLRLLHTLPVPRAAAAADGTPRPRAHRMPFEPRLMADGSILLNAFGCGFFRVTGIEADRPEIKHVYTIDAPMGKRGDCGIPVIVGNYWVMAVGRASMLVALDIRNPTAPLEVSRLLADTIFRPHWMARDPGSNRIIVGAENGGENRMLMARIDVATGRLSWDDSFRSEDGALGISFRREQWPHGRSGEAFGHAALFRQ